MAYIFQIDMHKSTQIDIHIHTNSEKFHMDYRIVQSGRIGQLNEANELENNAFIHGKSTYCTYNSERSTKNIHDAFAR